MIGVVFDFIFNHGTDSRVYFGAVRIKNTTFTQGLTDIDVFSEGDM